MNEFENFVFYGSWRTMLEGFDEETAKEILWNCMLLGTSGEINTSNPIVQGIVLGAMMPNIQKAKDRYQSCVENGKKGGRPQIKLNQEEVLKKKEELKTWKAVAESYGISEDTLRKERASWENTNDKPFDNLF